MVKGRVTTSSSHMNRDPLHQEIVQALAGSLDGNTFERCAQDLLGDAYRNLAPVVGGSDSGMDGAFGTAEGAFPLVCTVREDVIGNFRANIQTYLAEKQGPRRVVVATSQALTTAKRQNLEEEAAKLGVTIVNIHDAAYFADRLYRHGAWRLQLLGITGNPPALSTFPLVGRFVRPEILVGRDQDLEWLQHAQGDLLLVGHPGSGKTYLHQNLAAQGLCLFAVDPSRQRLAEAIREQQPSIVVVDDAHIHIALVEELMHLRAELGASFQIHANCWPLHMAGVQKLLRVPTTSVRTLQPLRRQEVLDLIKKSGIAGPDWLLHTLIQQSDGKPGLAMALIESCKTEDISRSWGGEAATEQLVGNLRLVRGEKDRCILAAFAVGGDIGMSFRDVSGTLNVPELELKQVTADLGSGGLVEEVGEDRLQVRPPAIRPVLVRDVFYCGASALDITPLLSHSRSAAATAAVLLSAQQRGANIDRGLLEAFVRAAGTSDIWEHFAWVDEQCTLTTLDKYPEQVCNAAPGLLHYSPSRALDALLDADKATQIQQAGAVEHPRRRIGEWLFPFDAEPQVTVERRLALIAVLEERVRQRKVGKGESFTWALAEILQPAFDIARTSPGDNRQIQCIRGVASHAILTEIAALWPRVKELFRHVPNSAAHIFFARLEDWCLPQRLSFHAPVPEETYQLIQRSGQQMLADILKMPQCNRAWRTRAATIARWAELDSEVSVDSTFDAVFADRDHAQNWEEEEKRRTAELQEVANNLVRGSRAEVIQYLDEIRAEATEFGYRNPNGHLWVIYHHIGTTCKDPRDWLDALVARSSPSEFVAPFVDRLSTEDSGQYEAALHHLLQLPEYQRLAIVRVLRLSKGNESLLSSALALLNDPELVEHLWLRDSGIPLEVVARILKHPNPWVRGAAAIGEWQREPAGTVRPELERQWRLAIRDVGPNHYALKDIFEQDSTLAFGWLEAQLRADRHLSMHDQAFHAACKAINREQRAQLLRLFTRKNYSDECFDLVMGEETDLFAEWLQYQVDAYLRLRPLDRDVGPRWEQMALLALEAGASPNDLADHCMPSFTGVMWGPFSQYFLERIPAYETLVNHADPRFRPAGQRGLDSMRADAERELQRERREEIYGE